MVEFKEPTEFQNQTAIQLQSTLFSFPISEKEAEETLNQMKSVSKEKYDFLQTLGSQIKKQSVNNDIETLKAIIKKHMNLIEFIRSDIEDAMLDAINMKNEQIVQYFVENGLKLSTKKLKNCILTLVSVSKYTPADPPIEILQLLLDYGAEVNCYDTKNFQLPIHKAAKYGIYDFVELLAEYGADINAVDKKKKMPLNYVENRVEEPEFEKICTFLRSNGAENDWMKDIKKDDEFNDLE